MSNPFKCLKKKTNYVLKNILWNLFCIIILWNLFFQNRKYLLIKSCKAKIGRLEMVMLVVVVTLFSIIEKGKKFWCSTLLIIEFSALLLWRSK